MNERDIRTAFQHLVEDVMASVKTEERLDQIAKRPTWVRSAFAAAAAVLAVRPDSGPDPVPPATGESTTTVRDTVATTTPPTTAGPIAGQLPELGIGTVVVANPGAATAATVDGVVFDADVVAGDGAGGVVLQRGQTVVRIAADGTTTTVLDGADLTSEFGPVTLRLEDAARIDGSMYAVAVTQYGQDYPDVYQDIVVVDLDGGAPRSLYRLVSVESNITRVSVAGGTVLATVSFEGGSHFEYLDVDGQPIDPPGPPLGPNGATEFDKPVFEGVLSQDGSKFAYLQYQDITTGEDGYYMADVIVWDLVDGVELQRVEIDLQAGESHPGLIRMDYDGAGIVLGYFASDGLVTLGPLRIESLADGTVTYLDTAGVPSLIK